MDPDEQEILALIEKVRARVDFDDVSRTSFDFSDDLSIALVQLDSRSRRLQRLCYPIFLKQWFAFYDGPGRLKPAECGALIKKVSDRASIVMVMYLCRSFLEGDTPISWRRLAEQAYEKGNASFPKTISEKMRSCRDAFEKLGVFEIDTIYREVGGAQQIARYNIDAGVTLKAFEQHIWRDLRMKQITKFAEKHLPR